MEPASRLRCSTTISPRLCRLAEHLSRRGLSGGSGLSAAAPTAGGGSHALSPGDLVCVTGAAGFVGGWLVRLLLERGHSVRACVRDAQDAKTDFLKAMDGYGSRLTLHAADMTQRGAYDEIFDGVTAVFHPAEVFVSAPPPHHLAGHHRPHAPGPHQPTTTRAGAAGAAACLRTSYLPAAADDVHDRARRRPRGRAARTRSPSCGGRSVRECVAI